MSEFTIRQRGLDGEDPDGQVTLGGDVVREEETEAARDARAAAYAVVQATAEYYADYSPEEEADV